MDELGGGGDGWKWLEIGIVSGRRRRVGAFDSFEVVMVLRLKGGC